MTDDAPSDQSPENRPLDPDLSGTNVLAIFAHPDDESLACGGTLARLTDAGARVVLICATHGERGSLTGPATNLALGRERVAEIHGAAAALGIADVLLLDHPDGQLRWQKVPHFHADIVLAIRHYRPDAIITFGADGLYWHLDHIGTYERTMTALRSLGPDSPALYHVTMPRGVMRAVVDLASTRGWQPTPKGFWSIVPDAFGLHAAPPTVVVDVHHFVERKLRAIRCHRSQMGADNPFEQIQLCDARRLLGVEHFHRTAAFGRETMLLENLGMALP